MSVLADIASGNTDWADIFFLIAVVLFVIRDNKANEVAVARGAKLGDLVAVTGDLKIGDKVVQKPGDAVQNGAAVRIEAK